MRVLLTGSGGYLGSLLAPELLRRGHDVVGLDTGFYRERSLYRSGDPAPSTLAQDVRRIQSKDLIGIDAVVHMGELSNDPAGQLSPSITYEINHHGSVRLARLAREAGVNRFIYTSSCSVYGIAAKDFVDETSPVNPQTAYGICKALVERDLKQLAHPDFCVTILRNATAYGASWYEIRYRTQQPRRPAWVTGEISMTSDGTPWRPLVHALDIARRLRWCSRRRLKPCTMKHSMSATPGTTIASAILPRLWRKCFPVVK